MDYAMPRAEGLPDFRTEFDTSIPCRTNPLGVKGVGELGTIGATPATMNAVADALAAAGVRTANDVQMPATAERVWQALQAKA
jgi:carbon-monoxide dehydrogenase large subunit